MPESIEQRARRLFSTNTPQFTGRTRYRWFFWKQYQYYGPVMPTRAQSIFYKNTMRDYYWSYDKPKDML